MHDMNDRRLLNYISKANSFLRKIKQDKQHSKLN